MLVYQRVPWPMRLFASMAAKAKVMASAPRESHSATGPAPMADFNVSQNDMYDVDKIHINPWLMWWKYLYVYSDAGFNKARANEWLLFHIYIYK